MAFQINNNIFATAKDAEIAQLVEHDLAKVGVAGSSPVFRSTVLDSKGCRNGGIGRHDGLKIHSAERTVQVRLLFAAQ